MLDKEQLLKTQKCIEQKSSFGCRKCENFKNEECPAYEKDLIETTLKYRDMLEKLQFVQNSGMIGGAIYKFCPICGSANINGHKKDCELAKLLK
ncbi:hypothetical protein GCM10008908_24500 [Clostridium subterminale]|uniref:Uncharacterized protein n=1 Tax=Clostridium subterminale TaxID=1550 RepID=A0ABN1KS10_CLOSU